MKIVIVDDDCLVTEALKTILEVNEDVQVLATGSDGRDAVCLYACLLYTSPSPRDA